MIAAKKVPTSKLIYASVFPGKIEVKTKNGLEEEVFFRLTKEFKVTPDIVRNFIDREKGIITSRGEDESLYYFGGEHNLDEILKAFYGSLDRIARVISYENNLNEFTFSELILFFNVLGIKYSCYTSRQLELEKMMRAEDKKLSKMLRSHALSSEKEAAYSRSLELKGRLAEQRDMEDELLRIFRLLRDCSLSKIGSQLGTSRNVKLAMRVLPEGTRVASRDNLRINLKEVTECHRNLENDVYSHDVDLLSDVDVRGFSLQKRK